MTFSSTPFLDLEKNPTSIFGKKLLIRNTEPTTTIMNRGNGRIDVWSVICSIIDMSNKLATSSTTIDPTRTNPKLVPINFFLVILVRLPLLRMR